MTEQHPQPEYQQPSAGPTSLPYAHPSGSVPSAPGPAGLRFASAVEAERSRRWRTSVGVACLILGAVAAFVAYLNIDGVIKVVGRVQAQGGYIRQSGMDAATIIIAAYCVVALAYLATGIWTLATRHSVSNGPVIATVVISALVIVAIIAMLVQSASTGSALHFGGLASNTVIIVRSIQVLRLKRENPMTTPDGPTYQFS